MALMLSTSPRVFNENAGKQVYDSGSTSSKGSKCHCCPFGYHIDLDFVEYCEAVAAGSLSDKATLERRKKREKRKQCQSMEILLGLVSPTIDEFETELSELAHDELDDEGGRADRQPMCHFEKSIAPELNEAIGDFEATLQRLSKKRTHTPTIDGSNTILAPTEETCRIPLRSVDFDNPCVGISNWNQSTETLQNIRQQMAVSLERMKQLEEQVKTIPILEIQISVLKEEKRDLQKQIQQLNEMKNFCHPDSFSSVTNVIKEFKDMATMCNVLTRDIGVSHQPTRTRDVGMVTSTPIPQSKSIKVSNHGPLASMRENVNFSTGLNDSLLPRLSMNSQTDENVAPEVCRKKRYNVNKLERGPLKIENILPEAKSFSRDTSTNTCRTTNRELLVKSHIFFEEIVPVDRKSVSSQTSLNLKNIYTAEDMTLTVEDAMKAYKESIEKNKVCKEVQCNLLVELRVARQDREIQVSEPFRMTTNVGITAKPKTVEIGTYVGVGPGTRSIASGPDPIPIHRQQMISLNSMFNQPRSHSFNYGDSDMRPKGKSTRSIGLIVEGLIKTKSIGIQTADSIPKTREFGTSPLKKKFVDVSVGDSLKPHISISCAANYCDNCKETIKSLAKQISINSTDHHQIRAVDNSTTIITSKIPRPFHISLNTHDHRRQFKRQDTYTKIPTGIIRYDADNKEIYHTSDNKCERMDDEVGVEEYDNLVSDYEGDRVGSKISKDEKNLPDSALFEPIREKSREKKHPSKEMRAAMKVLNDNLGKSSDKQQASHQTKNAVNVIQQEWFKISSTAQADPHDVEDYLDCFEEYSSCLLQYIVNMVDSSGNTAMHYAVSHGNFDVVSILLDSKVCDINKANMAGYTAVMLAALAEVRNSTHASVAKRLFQLADVNIRAKLHGQTALMLAVSHGRKDMTNLLLEAGAAVNIQDEDGSTALMCAAEHGHTDIVQILLAHPECDSSITDVDSSSALKIALEAGHRDIGILLYAHEHVNRGTSPYLSTRKSRRGSKPTTPTGPSPSAPASPALSRKFHSSNASLNMSRYSSK